MFGRRSRAVGALLLVTLFVGACGGDDEGDSGDSGEDAAQFDSQGVTFEYPGDWGEVEDISTTAEAGNLQWQEGVGVDSGNLILVSEYLLNIEITDENVGDLEAEIVTAIGGLVEDAGGTVGGDPEPTTVGGFPAYTFEASGITTVEDKTVDSRFILIFDGDTEYFLNCQYETDHEEEILAGCDQVVETFAAS